MGIFVMNSLYPCLLLMAILFLFRYRISLKGAAAIYLIGFFQYLLSYYLLDIFNQQRVVDYVVYALCCTMEYLVTVLVAFIVEYENVYLAIVTLMIYVATANFVMLIPISISPKLSEVMTLYMVAETQDNALYDLIILVIILLSGFCCSVLFGRIYRRLKNKNQRLYRALMIAIFWLMLTSAIIRRRYNENAGASENVVSTKQITVSAIFTFIVIFAIVNLATYVYNSYEVKRLRVENEETRRWIRGLQKQYRQVKESNQFMERQYKQAQESGSIEEYDSHEVQKNENDTTESAWNLSLTGNLLLDTLFTYYTHMAREKNVVFEIQSELAGGETVKVENYQISAGTRLVDEKGNEISIEDQKDKKLNQKIEEDIRLMQQIDLVTISDGVLSVYFEEAEEKEGYVFVNLKLGGGKLLLDYELNKELFIDRLSFGVCHRYKKLKPVRRIVHMKNGVADCTSKEGRQKISIMFVGNGE